MKINNIKALLASAAFLGSTLATPVFAANQYGIEYTGGEPLGSDNVRIDPALIDGLAMIAQSSSKYAVVFSNSVKWQEGYTKYGTTCTKVKYFKVWKNDQVSEKDNLYYTISNDKYTVRVNFNGIVVDNVPDLSENGNFLAVAVVESAGSFLSRRVFEDSKCENGVANNVDLSNVPQGGIFYQPNIKLYKKDGSIFKSNELYFLISDIDGSQSYKILNSDSLLSKNNMYAKAAAVLQPDPSITTLKNMFVANKNYIYSQFDDDNSWGFDLASSSQIYVKLGANTQDEGVNAVFGFANSAGSSFAFYAKQYKVEYKSDTNGEISGIEDETVDSGNNPSGSTSTPSDGYELDYWTADKDVVLGDGAVIKAGEIIAADQIKQVVVNENLVFTAHHKTIAIEPDVPNTGKFTSEMNAKMVAISMVAVALVAALIGLLPKLTHKKIGFKK